MPVTIKTANEIELMRAAGKILAKVHEDLGHVHKRYRQSWRRNDS